MWMTWLAGGALLLATVIAWRLLRALKRMSLPVRGQLSAELPTVSVCIPARNETHALAACLDRLLASDYPKLEVLVLDDASEDNTSTLIKSFAHAGVRFIPGTPLPEGWLGKNHALQTMAREASGSYICFMDVDTHVWPTTLSEMVAVAMRGQSAMVSVLPRREDVGRGSTVFRSLRYLWELVLSSKRRPVCSTSLWLIERTALENIEFAAYRDSVRPEFHLAQIFQRSMRYQALMASQSLRVAYEKKWSSQMETAIRLYYPMIGGVWHRGVATLIGLVVLASALPLVIVTAWTQNLIATVLALITVIICVRMYDTFLYASSGKRWNLASTVWPYLIIQEALFMAGSLLGYATRTVKWKGRLIASPSSNVGRLELNE